MTGDHVFVDIGPNLEPRPPEAIDFVREHLSTPRQFEAQIIDFASNGGRELEATPELPLRYAVNRVALGEADKAARQEVIRPMMEELNMEIFEHPYGLIAIRRGANPSEEKGPVGVGSHTDSIVDADMYDGNYGVLGALDVIRAINAAEDANEIEPLSEDIAVFAFTGEESTLSGTALFGSQGMFLGSPDDVLDSRSKGGPSIRELLEDEEVQRVQRPAFGDDDDQLPTSMKPSVFIELHVEQANEMVRRGLEVAVVTEIAAPVRYEYGLGGSTDVETLYQFDEHRQYFKLVVNGIEGHSGSTPMDERNDALLAMSILYSDYLAELFDPVEGSEGHFGDIDLFKQSMNKVSGQVSSTVRLGAESSELLGDEIDVLREMVKIFNDNVAEEGLEINVTLQSVEPEDVNDDRIATSSSMVEQTHDLMRTVQVVYDVSSEYADRGVVGTATQVTFDESGEAFIALDIRGSELQARTEAVDEMQKRLLYEFGEPKPGAGEPVSMNSALVDLAIHLGERGRYATVGQIKSKAGHDAQYAARSGIDTVMLFGESTNGLAHNVDAYSDPEKLVKGTALLSDMVVTLAA